MRRYAGDDDSRWQSWESFTTDVLENVKQYQVPVIKLTKETPKEAVCTVFEKVNTGGIPLNVFELLTATFAGDKTHRDFRLSDDWRDRRARLAAKPVLRSRCSRPTTDGRNTCERAVIRPRPQAS